MNIILLEQIMLLVAEKPKHFSQIIKRDLSLYQFVQDNKAVTSNILAEEIYSIIGDQSPYCKLGKKKKFNSINSGYKNCGPARICECTREKVSESVTVTKSQITQEEKEKTNNKRKETNLHKYGVENAAQTMNAIEAHQNFYKNKKNLAEVVDRVKRTKEERYGISTYNNPSQISQTWRGKSSQDLQQISLTRYQTYIQNNGTPSDHLTKMWHSRLVKYYDENFNISFLTPEEKYKGVSGHTYYDFLCNNCGYKFSTYIDNGHIPVCKKCNPTPKSIPELEIHNWLLKHNIDHEVNNRTVLNGKELDFYLPSLNIAIEYCGLYWHSDIHDRITKWTHFDKWKACRSLGIQLITIFSDQWTHKREIVLNRLSSKLNINKGNIGARKTSIIKLPKQEEKSFFLSNHIQGHNPSRVCYGLVENDQIIAAMNFKKVRYHSKDLAKDDWELLRFATITNVPGGANKLFKHFVKTYQPIKVVSYSDNDWNTGELYEKLGFQLSRKPSPCYWYVDVNKDIRYHRFNFRKKDGDPAGLTEAQRVFNKFGYLRFWDTGNTRWIWTR